jgi:7-cyano-7-deazaguanine synthase
MDKAIVLLSGGLDSTTTLFLALSKGYKVYCLIFDYGQKHKTEIKQARKIALRTGCQYRVVKIKLPPRAGALVEGRLRVPLDRRLRGIPSTYVPARNTIFLSFGLSWAESIGARVIFIGAHAVDYSGYPDCRPEYFNAFRKMADLATRSAVSGHKIEILTPFVFKSKAQIIKLGMKLKVPYELTWSCYKGGKSPCRRCDSCILRAKGFKEAGLKDPIYD